MTTEEYVESMAGLGIGRGLLGEDFAFPPDFGSPIEANAEPELLNPRASMRVVPPGVATCERLQKRHEVNAVTAYLLGARRYRWGGTRLTHVELSREAWRRARTPQEKLYALLFKRHSGSRQLAREAGLSVQYTRAVLAGRSRESARREVAKCLTAEELAVLGWDLGAARKGIGGNGMD